VRRPLTLALALATAACTTLGTGAAPRPPGPFRVLVYNVHAGKDAAGVENLARVAEVVRSTGADLVLLQEVDRGTERSGRVDQLAVLARLTGFHAAYGKTLDFQGGAYGVALLSRWPVAADTLHLLDPPEVRADPAFEPRGALRARVAAPRGALHLLNTHLDAGRADTHRLREVAALLEIAASLRASRAPVLLGGDFNATPESAVIGRVRQAGWRDAWAVCGVGEGFTFPAEAPVRRIDYLFVPPGAACEGAEVVGGEVSDHRGVVFTVRMDRPSAR
jgi:endonuclease/exonuclease/phosphatase family metal-dependent hydrolase